MEPEGSLPCSQQPTPCPYLEPDQFSSNPHSFPSRSILILNSHLRLGIPSRLLPSTYHTQTLHTLYCAPCVLHAPPSLLLDLIARIKFSAEYKT
jgi:hypothetical protein